MEIKYTVMFALLGLLLVPLANAADVNQTKQDMLNAAMANIACKADFMGGVISSIDANVPSASLGSFADALKADEQNLQGMASAGDWEGFRSSVHGTFDPDMKSAREAVESLRKDDGKNLTNDTRATLRADYEQLRTTYQACESSAMSQYAGAKIDWYNTVLDDYQARADRLNAKGVQTSDLSALISDARSQIVSPLQAAVDAASNTSQVREALGQYCLFNGCNGTNFHMAARFESDKLGDVLSYIQPTAQSDGLGDNVTSAQAQLGSVQSELSSIGTSEYADGQKDEVWSGIKSVAGDVKGILDQIRHKLP
jgi:hypothetical protein